MMNQNDRCSTTDLLFWLFKHETSCKSPLLEGWSSTKVLGDSSEQRLPVNCEVSNLEAVLWRFEMRLHVKSIKPYSSLMPIVCWIGCTSILTKIELRSQTFVIWSIAKRLAYHVAVGGCTHRLMTYGIWIIHPAIMMCLIWRCRRLRDYCVLCQMMIQHTMVCDSWTDFEFGRAWDFLWTVKL